MPTIIELGGTIDTVTPGYFTFALPAGTPEPIMRRLIAELTRAIERPDIAERLLNAGLDPHVMTPVAFVDSVRADLVRFAKVAKSLAVEPQ